MLIMSLLKKPAICGGFFYAPMRLDGHPRRMENGNFFRKVALHLAEKVFIAEHLEAFRGSHLIKIIFNRMSGVLKIYLYLYAHLF